MIGHVIKLMKEKLLLIGGNLQVHRAEIIHTHYPKEGERRHPYIQVCSLS